SSRRRLVVVVRRDVADGAREADRQFAAGIHLAEDDVGNGASAVLTEIPELEDRRRLLDEMSDRGRPAAGEQRDDWVAGGGDRVDQLILTADEIQRRPIAEMIERPGFARGLLVVADREQHHVRLRGDGGGFADRESIGLRVAWRYVVCAPRAADGDLAPLVI